MMDGLSWKGEEVNDDQTSALDQTANSSTKSASIASTVPDVESVIEEIHALSLANESAADAGVAKSLLLNADGVMDSSQEETQLFTTLTFESACGFPEYTNYVVRRGVFTFLCASFTWLVSGCIQGLS
jgi:hypothetical protein